MSELMVLGFDNEAAADEFGLKLQGMQAQMIVQLEDASEVVRDPDGKPHVKTGSHLVGAGAMGGAFWGMLFGLLFFVPFLGLAFGAAMGALFGKMGKTGIDREVTNLAPPGAEPRAPRRFNRRMESSGPLLGSGLVVRKGRT